jgi:hypothetical protein
MGTQQIRCERCGEVLKPDKVVWLEHSNTNGKYYRKLPPGHISQGSFAFGATCAKKEVSN